MQWPVKRPHVTTSFVALSELCQSLWGCGFPSPWLYGQLPHPRQWKPRSPWAPRLGSWGRRQRETENHKVYTSATLGALPNQRLFPNQHFASKTQLNQVTSRFIPANTSHDKKDSFKDENVTMVVLGILVWSWLCSHSSHWRLRWAKVGGRKKREGERRICFWRWLPGNFKG